MKLLCRFCNDYHYRWKACKAQLQAITEGLPKRLEHAGMRIPPWILLPAHVCLPEEVQHGKDTLEKAFFAAYKVADELIKEYDPVEAAWAFLDQLEIDGYLIVRKEELGDGPDITRKTD